ncbi:MAG: hypothetical protein OHK93_001715 [Ramalina farinacea]|uniref:Uncharacterized protein n=1 Tax=Ramalina farinacea TaxID=258253 RepID=A0AA43QSR6_9LECA|nr:hypothetical protein [Ramalina farinacea]
MAETDEEVQYLLESRLHYGESRPPFARNSLPSRSNNSTVRLADTGEIQVVHHRRYPTTERIYAYATIQIQGLVYIVCALPKGWSHGDPTYSLGGTKDWFVWQGLNHEFRGPLFDGPVAKSAGRIGTKAKRQSGSAADTWPSERSTRPAGKLRRTAKRQAVQEVDASPSQRPSNPPRKARTTSKRDYSPPFFEGSPEPNQGFSHAASHPDTVELICLTLSQEYATHLHVKLYKDQKGFSFLRLRSAGPQTDPDSAVTNESLFEKITGMANKAKRSTGEIYALEATFCTDFRDNTGIPDEVDSHWPDAEPLMIIRGEEDTFEYFQSYVLAFSKLNDQLSWYVDLRVIAD